MVWVVEFDVKVPSVTIQMAELQIRIEGGLIKNLIRGLDCLHHPRTHNCVKEVGPRLLPAIFTESSPAARDCIFSEFPRPNALDCTDHVYKPRSRRDGNMFDRRNYRTSRNHSPDRVLIMVLI